MDHFAGLDVSAEFRKRPTFVIATTRLSMTSRLSYTETTRLP